MNKQLKIKFMKNVFLFFGLSFLYLLFNSLALAEMSDAEKREFIESLSKTSKEKKVFYRWQSETVRDNLLEAGEMTPKLYKHYMNVPDTYGGAGIYVAEDMISSAGFGNTIIQVELEPGYKYLDIRDKEVQKKLKAKGLTNEDVYRLNPRVAVSDITEGKSWWVLKRGEGVKFKVVSSSLIKTAGEGSYFLSGTGKYLEPEERKKIVRKTISLIKTAGEGSAFLSKAGEYLDSQDRKEVVRKSIPLIKTAREGSDLLMYAGEYLEPEERKKIVRKTISLIKTAGEGNSFLSIAGEYLEPEESEEILRKIISLETQVKEVQRLNCLKKQLSTP